MKVLLINPEFPDTYWSFRHALPFEGKRCALPPLGLLTVSALLPESWERRLIDLNVESLKSTDIEWADMVFATAMLVQKESLRDVVRRCKARGKRVVLGGPYVTTTIEELPEADHVFLGEAETTLPQFIEDLARGEAKRTYQAAERPPLSATPMAHFHLANMKRYSAMSIQYSRGCPFSCEFCDIIEIYGRVPRNSMCFTTSIGVERSSSSTTISSATRKTCGYCYPKLRHGRRPTVIHFRCLLNRV